MSTGEDEASSRNGRLRPRKSVRTCTPSPQIKTGQKTESKRAAERPKRSSTSLKASSNKQDDLSAKPDIATAALFMCPYCDRKFNARQTASKHARRIHLSATKQDNFIKCLYCNLSEADSNAIIKHMVDSHPNQYFACLDCHTRFPGTTELAEHKLNVCDKQKLPYRSRLRQKSSARATKTTTKNEKSVESDKNTQYTEDVRFNGIVISCELKPCETHDAADIEDKITTNLILPSAKTSFANTGMDKNAVIVLDDFTWNKRIAPNFSFHNTDADQILSRLGVVHRSPRVGESKKDLIRLMDEPNEKFEKCFDTSFYTKVAKNVQENLAKYVDGTFNFNPHRDSSIKTRKSKASVVINTAEGFPILLAHEQFSRHLFDGFMPRAIAPKHKWKWDSTENDKSLMMLLDQTKRDSHANNCIITLISSLDIWTQLRMKSKFEDIYKTTPTAKKTEKQNKIGTELKEILESRDIPPRFSPVVHVKKTPVNAEAGLELPSYLGLSASRSECELQPAVLSGEWVRPRCYVCCACGEQTRDARTLTSHLATQHPNAQVQHYEIVGETLLSADILKHLYVPPSQMSNRTRPPRGFRDCTKCKKSITLEDLHQHMLDCAGDTPAVRRKCRYRPFGVRRRRPRMPDNIIRKKMRKDMSARHKQKSHMRPRPRIRTEVGDAETIRKMIADLPAKRNRFTPANALRPRRAILKTKTQVKLRTTADKNQHKLRRQLKTKAVATAAEVEKKHNDTDNSSTIDDDDQPLKVCATRVSTRSGNGTKPLRRKIINKNKKKKLNKKEQNMNWFVCQTACQPKYNIEHGSIQPIFSINENGGQPRPLQVGMPISNVLHQEDILLPEVIRQSFSHPQYPPYLDTNQRNAEHVDQSTYVNRSALQCSDERIDVTRPGSSNVRQHSGQNDNNAQKNRGHAAGAGEGSNKNKDTSKISKVTLKHSIAIITSDNEHRDLSNPYHGQYIASASVNQPFVYEPSERKDFESEATVEEVDKPPLPSSAIVEEYMGFNSLVGIRDSQRHPYSYGTGEVRLQEPLELGASAPQLFMPNEAIVADRSTRSDLRQPSLINEFHGYQESIEDLSMQKNTNELYKNADTKLESGRSKSNKVRKVLNIENCIAKIRTKKGLPIDETGTRSSEVEKQTDSERNAEKSDNAVVSSKSEEPLTQNTEITVEASQIQREAKPELSITKSAKRSELTKSSTHDHKTESASEFIPPRHEFLLSLSKLSNFWHSFNIERNDSMQRTINSTEMKKTIQMLKDLNVPTLTESLAAISMSERNEEVNWRMLYDFSFHMLYKNYNKPFPEGNGLLKDLGDAYAYFPSLRPAPNFVKPVGSQVSTDSESTLEKNTSQLVESPTSRRTRRKPASVKTSTANEKLQLNREQIMHFKHNTLLTVSPSPKRDIATPLDCNSSIVANVSHSKPRVMDPHHLRIPPPPPLPPPPPPYTVRARRDSYRRISNSSDTSPNFYETKEMSRTSPSDMQAEKMHQQLVINSLRRQSIEMAYAQTNYNIAAQTYRMEMEAHMEYERIKNNPGSDALHKLSPAREVSFIEQSNQNAMKRYPHPIISPLEKDVHENVPGAGCSNQSTTRGRQRNKKLSHDGANKQKSVKLITNEDNKLKNREHLDKNVAYHETQTAPKYHSLESETRKSLPRRSSEAFHSRSSAFDNSEPSTSSLHKSDTRMYHEPVPSFAAPSRSPMICEAATLDEAPLDLSCVRKEVSSINLCIKEKQNNTSVTPNFRRNFDPFQTHHQQTSMREYRFESINDFTRQTTQENAESHEISEMDITNHNEISKQFPTIPPTVHVRAANTDARQHLVFNHQSGYNDEIMNENVGNMSSGLSNTQYFPGADNCPTLYESQTPIKNDSDFHDNTRKTSIIENKDISRPMVQVGMETKFDNDYIINENKFPATNVGSKMETSNDDQSVGHHLTPENVPANISIQDHRSNETSQISHQKARQNDTDQDAETARKIALLPEELVKVLGTIPKDHRNQLLNILPQYVAAPVSQTEHDNKNTASVSMNLHKNETRPEPKEDTMLGNGSNTLTVNTAISPNVGVIPKKRHSPSQSRGRLNSGESQSTVSLLPHSYMPTTAQQSPIEYNESRNAGPGTSYIYDKTCENINTEINNRPQVNKADVSVPEISVSPVTSTRLPIPNLPTKQKASNEQTASLRAVRIKTTSARKSFCDEKRLLVNYAYKTNTCVEEITTSSSLVDQEKTKSDDDKAYNKQLDTGIYISGETSTETGQRYNDMIIPKSDISTENEANSANHKHKENDNVLLDLEQNIYSSYENIESTFTADSQDKPNSFINQVTKPSSVVNLIVEPDMHLVQPPMISPDDKPQEKMVTSTIVTQPTANYSQNILANMELQATDQNTIKSNVTEDMSCSDFELPVSTEKLNVKQSIPLEEKNLIVLPQKEKESESKPETNKSNGEDSDDDVALAIIKQKHCSLPNNNRDKKTTTKQNTFINKNESKQKRSQQNKISKRRKKRSAKNSQMSNIPPTNESPPTEIAENVIHNVIPDTKKDNTNSSDVSDGNTDKVNLGDINKENTGTKSQTDVENKFDDSNSTQIPVQEDKGLDELPENKMTTFAEPANSPTGLKLSSESSDLNVFPLRRSRRGKSMYVDSILNIEDNDKNEDISKATPLTMKRLILSRVEKDKKRISECVVEKSNEIIDDLVPIQCDEPKAPIAKKGKLAKRKKSPHQRRTTKKSRPSSTCEPDDDYPEMGASPDTSSLQSENNSFILRELPNAENKISDTELSKDELKCRALSDNTTNLSENTSIVSKEKDTESINDDLVEINETSTSVKRKLNITKVSEINSAKPKKIKYKSKSQYEFDSDDDRTLLEAKPSLKDKSVKDNDSKEETEKEKDDQEQTLQNEIPDDSTSTSASNIPAETRTTCYNRSISQRKPRSSSETLKDSSNYDPYDIDFEDMPETAKPIIKKKGKATQSGKLANDHRAMKTDELNSTPSKLSKQTTSRTIPDVSQESDSDSSKSDEPLLKYLEEKALELALKNEYSSRRSDKNCSEEKDEPLLKYLEEEALELALKNEYSSRRSDKNCSEEKDEPLLKYLGEEALELALKNEYSSRRSDKNCSEEKEKVPENKDCDNVETLQVTENKYKKDAPLNDNKVEITTITSKVQEAGMLCLVCKTITCCEPGKCTESTNPAATDNKTPVTEVSAKDDGLDSNIIPVDQNKQKQPSKQKKSRRQPTISDDTESVSNEVDQKLRSDKFMENFGFYSERIPRKSNLLATKKISETFHLISDEMDDCFSGYKEKTRKATTSENKKKIDFSVVVPAQEPKTVVSEVATIEVKPVSCEDMTYGAPSTEAQAVVEHTFVANEPDDTQRKDDSDLDSLSAQAIMDSEEVRNLENDLFSGLREAAKANAARNCFVSYQPSSELDAAKPTHQNDPVLRIEDNHSVEEIPEATKKCPKTKPAKYPGDKPMMYPDEEIDMFEDKFDKIKRKRRSQAVAAKQQAVETNTSSKSRKQSEKKRIAKTSKKNCQSGQVPTKGALKGFEGIKISIPTQDLNLPINISPPRQSKKRRKTANKRKKESSDSEDSDFNDGDKFDSERDIYEFIDSEDAELFDLRPSTVMDRFRSMHKSKPKCKDKEKVKEDRERIRSRDKQRREKDFTDSDTKAEYKKSSENTKSSKKSVAAEERFMYKSDDSETGYSEKNTKTAEKSLDNIVPGVSIDEDAHKRYLSDKSRNSANGNGNKDADDALPSTSGFVPNRIDESDYESEMSSPEGDFIFYTSNDVNCACPSENESDDSDTDRGCGRLNCLNKNKNADKNAAIGNIFKNNAVRCEKPEIKELDIPKPDLDQLFDSLLETESKPNDKGFAKIDASELEPSVSSVSEIRRRSPMSPERHHDIIKSKKGDSSHAKNDIVSNLHESGKNQPVQLNRRHENQICKVSSKSDYASSLSQNAIPTESDSTHILFDSEKPKDNHGYSKLSKESSPVNLNDINAEISYKTDEKRSKLSSKDGESKSSSLDFDWLLDPDTDIILPGETASTCAQVDSKIDQSDAESGNESAASKYLKGLTPSEAANMEIYTMVSAQGTQTDKPSRHESGSSKHAVCSRSKSQDELDTKVIPRSRIRLQKFDIREITQKSSSTKSIQTEKHKSLQPLEQDNRSDSDDEILHQRDLFCKKSESSKSTTKNVADAGDVEFPSEHSDTFDFTAPSSISLTSKHSPKKSDEGIANLSSDAFEGVARQRARRKCTVGKQNVLAEHWSSESEVDGGPARPNSADSTVAGGPRRKKSKKREGHHAASKRARGGRAPPGPKIRARAPHHYWSSEGEEAAGPQPQHGWIVGDSHKKLVTMLAHAKGRKRAHDKHAD